MQFKRPDFKTEKILSERLNRKSQKTEVLPIEEHEEEENQVICSKCNGTSFTAYITKIVDDVRLYCTNCYHKEI